MAFWSSFCLFVDLTVFLFGKIMFKVDPLNTNPTKWSNSLKQFVVNSWQSFWVCLIILWGWRLEEKVKKKVILRLLIKVDLESCQTSLMEFFTKIANVNHFHSKPSSYMFGMVLNTRLFWLTFVNFKQIIAQKILYCLSKSIKQDRIFLF